MPGMEINLGFTGLDAAVRRMRELEQAAAGVARNLQGGGGGGGGAAAGPVARAAAAQRGLAGAQAGGDPGAIFDAQVRAIRAQQSVERAQRLLSGGPNFQERLRSFVSTTRFGGGGGGGLGGAMPLVGRTAALFGGEAAAAMTGPLGLAVAGAAAAITAFGSLVSDAGQAVGEFRRGMVVTGGTPGETARLAAMGIAPGQQGAAAASLRERLVSGPRAQAAAQRIGLALPGHRLSGEVNEARGLAQALELLRVTGRLRGAEEQLREARELGLEAHLDELRVSERVWRARQGTAAVQGDIMERNAQQFRDLDAESARAAAAMDALKTSIGGLVAPQVEYGKRLTADFLTGAAYVVDKLKPPESAWEKSLRAMEEKQGGAEAATKENTEALRASTRMIEEGIFGGGERARGAIPSALRGRLVAEGIEGERLKLGVFGN
jgi:hypothetical protein